MMKKRNKIKIKNKFSLYLTVIVSVIVSFNPPALAQTDSPPVFFESIRVFDGQQLLENQSVLIQEGVIKEIGKELPIPAKAQIIEGKGKTLLPGFIDAHTHLYEALQLRQAAIFGVTTQLDMFSTVEVFTYLKKLLLTELGQNFSDFRTSGLLATAPGGHGTEYGFTIPTLTTPEEAEYFVQARIAEGSDYIKIVYDNYSTYGLSKPTLSQASLTALIQAAHRHDKLALVHIGSLQDGIDALTAGADGLVHLSVENRESPELVQAAVRHGAFIIPTMTILESMCGIQTGQSLLDEPLVTSFLPQTAQTNLKKIIQPKPSNTINCQQTMAYIKALHLSGVPLLTGSDVPNPGTAYGASIHRELELFVEAGLSPLEALKSATSLPAKAFKLTDRGQIKKGLRADLVMIQGDPSQNIKATRHILGVWKEGHEIDRQAFQQSLKEATSTYQSSKGLISDFKNNSYGFTTGSGWEISTDQLMGGKSSAALNWSKEGANQKEGSLLIKGVLNTTSAPQPWAGAIFFTGLKPFQGADLSGIKTLKFWTKGNGDTHYLLLFSGSENNPPAVVEFKADKEWKEISTDLSTLEGLTRQAVWGILFANRANPGEFEFQIDEVSFE